MTDQQLQLALAKMLPERTIWYDKPYWIVKIPYESPAKGEGERIMYDTEWLHVCWLVEKTLTEDQAFYYAGTVQYNSPWQQRAEALCKVKGKTA